MPFMVLPYRNLNPCVPSSSGLMKEQLLSWAENTLKPIANQVWKGEGDFRAGSHCQFCGVKASCRKRAEYNLEIASNLE